MKKYFCSLFYFILLSFLIGIPVLLQGQEYFVKHISLNDNEPSLEGIQNLHLKDNGLFAAVRGICPPVNNKCVHLTEFDLDGEVLENQTLKWFKLDGQDIILDGDTIILAMSNFSVTDSVTIHKRTIQGDSLSTVVHTNSYSKYKFINSDGFLKYRDKYILSGTCQFKEDNDSLLVLGYLSVFNNDLSLDTIVEISDSYWNRAFDMAIGPDELLSVFLQRDIDVFPFKQRCIFKYNDKFERIWSWCGKEVAEDGPPRSGIVTSNGMNIISFQYDDDQYEMRAVNEIGDVLWGVTSNARTQRKAYGHFWECQNGDILSASFYGGRYTYVPTPFISRVDSNGKVLWERAFINKFFKDPIAKQSYFSDVIELTNGDIYAGGRIDTIIEYPNDTVRTQKILLAKLDSFGCIEYDRCNDFIVYGIKSDTIYHLDQLNTYTKKWYYTITNPDSSTYVSEANFKRDTVLWSPTFNQTSLYKHFSITNQFGKELIDEYKIRYDPTGLVIYLHPDNFWDCCVYPDCCDSEENIKNITLYDFRLNVGDEFRLPAEFGTATVVKVDSISLLDGYLRKRIVLQHDNELNQQKYGNLIWIEGIGSPNGIFYHHDWQRGTRTSLNCYYDRGVKRYGGAENCEDIFTNTNEISNFSNLEVVIYPNPARYGFTILSDQDVDRIELYDLTGNLVLTSTELKVILDTFSSGIYFCKIYVDDRLVATEKIVKL